MYGDETISNANEHDSWWRNKYLTKFFKFASSQLPIDIELFQMVYLVCIPPPFWL